MKFLFFLIFVFIFSSSAAGEDSYAYLSASEISKLPKEQSEFIDHFILASRSGNEEMMGKLFHSCVKNKPHVFSRLVTHYANSKIQEVYAVLIKPGKSKDALYFNIRHEQRVENGKKNTSFMLLKDVVFEHKKLVIQFRCNE